MSRALARTRSINNKGLVNEYRCPKLAYYTVKKYIQGSRKLNNVWKRVIG